MWLQCTEEPGEIPEREVHFRKLNAQSGPERGGDPSLDRPQKQSVSASLWQNTYFATHTTSRCSTTARRARSCCARPRRCAACRLIRRVPGRRVRVPGRGVRVPDASSASPGRLPGRGATSRSGRGTRRPRHTDDTGTPTGTPGRSGRAASFATRSRAVWRRSCCPSRCAGSSCALRGP